MGDRKLKSIPELLIIALFSFIFSILTLINIIYDVIRKGPSRVFNVKERNVRPEILCDSTYGTHEFLMLKNSRMKIHCVCNGDKSKPLMLFLHGFPEFWYSWRHQLKEFCNDYRVVAIDMRGYGDSDKPSSVSDYHIDYLMSDVSEVITLLGYDKCILVAHDWGGAVAWSFAICYPKMVDKLIVCNCPHPAAFAEHLKSTWGQFMKSWYMFLFQAPLIPTLAIMADDLRMISSAFCGRKMGAKKGAFTEEDLEAFKYTMARYGDIEGPLNYYRAMMRYRTHSVRKTKIACPVLVVWGTKDGALDSKMAELSGKYVEDYTLRWVDCASHWVQQEEPKIVNNHMREFLKNKC